MVYIGLVVGVVAAVVGVAIFGGLGARIQQWRDDRADRR